MMSKVNALMKREIRSYFWSPLAYVLMGVFLFLMGSIFTKFLILYQQYNFQQTMGAGPSVTLDKLANYFYQNMAFVICFIAPFVTMRLYAEEKRQSTMELLLTAPVTSLSIVLSKYLSAMALITTVVVLTVLYVVFLVSWGNPDIQVILSTYLGLILMLSAYISVGALISAFTSSQAIAAIFTFLTVLLLWLFQAFGQGMTATTGFIEWGPLLIYLSPLSHFSSFANGLIQVKDVVYFVSFTAVALFFTHQVVESHRWN
jgi:ABC-2 type transport system permease protein